MTDFAVARRMMVDGQIRPYDVTEQNLLAAMLAVPRERLVPPAFGGVAYTDLDIPLGAGHRCLLKPLVLARLLQAAAIGPGDRVLDVGCGTGYSAALLARLAGSVVALEEDAALAAQARRALADVGAGGVTVVEGPLAAGWPAGGPYDVILLDGGAEIVPEELFKQIKDGGRLVGVVGEKPAMRAMLYRSVNGVVGSRPIFDAVAAPLPGFSKPPAFAF